MSKPLALSALALPLALLACGEGPTAPIGAAQVAVTFAMNASGASASRVAAPLAGASAGALFQTASSAGLVVRGTNGTLEITNIGFIVSELELECEDEDADDDEDAGTDTAPACVEFEAPASFVKLPLGTGAVEVASQPIPQGAYSELEFEVENLEADEEDSPAERQQIADLLNSIRTVHGLADFPDRASMVVEGTFTPANGGKATAFRAYFEAEIEVEMELVPSLTISGAGASRELAVDVQPALWFRKADGTVMDLSRFDFATTGALIEFELEMHEGFTGIEIDD